MNQKIRLQPMDRVLLHEYYKGFVRAEISIKKADKNDLKKIYDMQLTAFRPLLDKY